MILVRTFPAAEKILSALRQRVFDQLDIFIHPEQFRASGLGAVRPDPAQTDAQNLHASS